ncbi:MAG TPA: hypothetical protein VMX38_16025 [Verrucomicrobiae bacterium]|nr:hypothetical protein [Verrucomicrobiae bacterium]
MQLILGFGDSWTYMHIADAIRTWSLSGLQVKQFWGLSYAIAGLSKLTGLGSLPALLILSAGPSLAAVILAGRLWDARIAILFAILNFDWLQRSFLGGSEPLFVFLLFTAFLAMRRQRWKLAALLASLATITRPLGVLLLIGIGIDLLLRRQWRQLFYAVAIAAVIAVLYVTPLRVYLHDPLATVHSYDVLKPDSPYPPLFGIPFRAIIVGTLRIPSPITSLTLNFGWIFLILVGNIAMLASPEFRAYARSHRAEAIFIFLYSLSLYCYNLPSYARSNFARFAIPILPFVFLALQLALPRLFMKFTDRRLLWLLTVVAAVLAALSAIGIHNL